MVWLKPIVPHGHENRPFVNPYTQSSSFTNPRAPCMALGKDLRVFVLSLRSTFGDRLAVVSGRVSRFLRLAGQVIH